MNVSLRPVFDQNKVQLFWKAKYRQELIRNAEAIARDVIVCGRKSGMEVQRSVRSISGEIQAHAIKGHDAQTNPMDIEMKPTPFSWLYNVLAIAMSLKLRRR